MEKITRIKETMIYVKDLLFINDASIDDKSLEKLEGFLDNLYETAFIEGQLVQVNNALDLVKEN